MTIPEPRSAAHSVRLLAFAVTLAPLLLGVVIYAVDGATDGTKTVSWLAIGASLAAAVVGAAACQFFGYRLQPLPTGRADGEVLWLGVQRYRTAMMVRFAFAELPALVAFAMTFAMPPTYVVNYLPGGLAAVLLLALHVIPNRTAVRRSEQALDRDGGHSQLSQGFGY